MTGFCSASHICYFQMHVKFAVCTASLVIIILRNKPHLKIYKWTLIPIPVYSLTELEIKYPLVYLQVGATLFAHFV